MSKSKITVNEKNLTALGAPRLAQILLSTVAQNTLERRRLRYELAREFHPYALGDEVKKRCKAIGAIKAQRIGQKRMLPLLDEMAVHRGAIEALAQVDPTEAVETFFDLAYALDAMEYKAHKLDAATSKRMSSMRESYLKHLISLCLKHRIDADLLSQHFLKLQCYGYYHMNILEEAYEAWGPEGFAALRQKISELHKHYVAQEKAATDPAKKRIYGSRKNQLNEIKHSLPVIEGDVKTCLDHFLDRSSRRDPASIGKWAQHISFLGLRRGALACLDSIPRPKASPKNYIWYEAYDDNLNLLDRKKEADDLRWHYFKGAKNALAVDFYTHPWKPATYRHGLSYEYLDALERVKREMIHHFSLQSAMEICFTMCKRQGDYFSPDESDEQRHEDFYAFFSKTFHELIDEKANELDDFSYRLLYNFHSFYHWSDERYRAHLIICRKLISKKFNDGKKRWRSDDCGDLSMLLSKSEKHDKNARMNAEDSEKIKHLPSHEEFCQKLKKKYPEKFKVLHNYIKRWNY